MFGTKVEKSEPVTLLDPDDNRAPKDGEVRGSEVPVPDVSEVIDHNLVPCSVVKV